MAQSVETASEQISLFFTIQNGPDPQQPNSFFKKLIELLQISLGVQYKINIFLSDYLLVALEHHGTRLPPDYVQIASRLPPKDLFGVVRWCRLEHKVSPSGSLHLSIFLSP